jgi:hypothetical protein
VSAKWYYAKNGQRFGPFTLDQFRQMAVSGLLTPTDMVCNDEANQWLSATCVEGLFSGAVQHAFVPTAGGTSQQETQCTLSGCQQETAIQDKDGDDQKGTSENNTAPEGSKPPTPISNPFRFRSGHVVQSLEELIALCGSHWEDAKWHLMKGDLAFWLFASGNKDAAEHAKTVRMTCHSNPNQALLEFLKACGPEGQRLANERVASDLAQQLNCVSDYRSELIHLEVRGRPLEQSEITHLNELSERLHLSKEETARIEREVFRGKTKEEMKKPTAPFPIPTPGTTSPEWNLRWKIPWVLVAGIALAFLAKNGCLDWMKPKPDPPPKVGPFPRPTDPKK